MPQYKLGRGPVFTVNFVRGVGSHPFHPSVMPLIRCISNMNSHKFFG